MAKHRMPEKRMIEKRRAKDGTWRYYRRTNAGRLVRIPKEEALNGANKAPSPRRASPPRPAGGCGCQNNARVILNKLQKETGARYQKMAATNRNLGNSRTRRQFHEAIDVAKHLGELDRCQSQECRRKRVLGGLDAILFQRRLLENRNQMHKNAVLRQQLKDVLEGEQQDYWKIPGARLVARSIADRLAQR